jgi:transcriptional regulator with XRE-family HTH domain
MLNLKQADLAAAEVSLATLNNIEREIADPRASTLTAIQRALEAAGVEFVDDRDAPGVRLRRRPS